jgi:hypothetical protein
VQTDDGALGGQRVLAQVDPDETDSRFPLAIADEPSLRDLRLSVKCKAVSGRIDQACGLAFRYRDPENYYVARANALEDNVRLYQVKDGRRNQFASWSGSVSAGQWHELRVEARGIRIEVFWEGEAVIDTEDRTFQEAGRVGLWTKADSLTFFDDLAVEAL